MFWITLKMHFFELLLWLWSSISVIASLVGIPTGIANYTVGFKITAGIKNYKLLIDEKRKEHHKIILLT